MKNFPKFLFYLVVLVASGLISNAHSYSYSAKSPDLVRYNKEDLNRLFNFQIQNLKNSGCSEEVLALLQNQHDEVILKAQQISFVQGNIAFLSVIPRSVLDLKKLMNMVQVEDKKGKKRGKVFLVVSALTDTVKVPTVPYYIYDIENGRSLRDRSPRDAKIIVTWDGTRRCLTVEETIALCIQTNTLSDFNLWAMGSRYSADWVPCVWYMRANGPMLSWDCKDCYDKFWGTPSCLK